MGCSSEREVAAATHFRGSRPCLLGRLAFLLALVALPACTGAVGDQPSGPSDTPRRRPDGPLEPLEPLGVARIPAAAYRNTIESVLGVGMSQGIELPLDHRHSGSTVVGGREISLSVAGVRAYEDAAVLIAERISAESTRWSALSGCDPAGDEVDTCVVGLAQRVGRRLFRRPIVASDIDPRLAMAQDEVRRGNSVESALETVLVSLLLSPHFLYRVEVGPALGDGADYVATELASRLALFLWMENPDDELLDAAERGDLDSEAGLSAQIERMLGDSARVDRGARSFVEDLWELDRDETKDPAIFPEWSPELLARSRESVFLLALDSLRRREPFLDVLNGHRAYVDASTATLWGLDAASFGDEHELVELPASGQRAGLLTEPYILAMSSRESVTSPTLRGLFVLHELLCEAIPAPPADAVTSLPELLPGQSRRAQVEAHTRDPVCAGCHATVDQIGFGLEGFDPIGRERTEDHGVPVDTHGHYAGEAFEGPVALSLAVRSDPRAPRCLALRTLRHATGLPLDPYAESSRVAALTERFLAQGGSLEALLSEVARSDAMRVARRIEP